MAVNGDVPVSLTRFIPFEDGLSALKDGRIGWQSPDVFKGPFENNSESRLDFNEKQMVEEVIREITHMVFARDAPSAKCDHPVFKAVRRWRNEDRFQNEEEVADALKDIVPSLVQPQFALATHTYKTWRSFVRKTRMLVLSETIDNLRCWQEQADNHHGIGLRFRSGEEGILENPRSVNYGNQRLPVTSLKEQIEILFGELKTEDVPLPEDRLLCKPKVYREEKEWRCFHYLDKDEDKEAINEMQWYSKFEPEELTAIYLGVGLSSEEKKSILAVLKKDYKRTKIFEGHVRQFDYALEFDKIEL